MNSVSVYSLCLFAFFTVCVCLFAGLKALALGLISSSFICMHELQTRDINTPTFAKCKFDFLMLNYHDEFVASIGVHI